MTPIGCVFYPGRPQSCSARQLEASACPPQKPAAAPLAPQGHGNCARGAMPPPPDTVTVTATPWSHGAPSIQVHGLGLYRPPLKFLNPSGAFRDLRHHLRAPPRPCRTRARRAGHRRRPPPERRRGTLGRSRPFSRPARSTCSRRCGRRAWRRRPATTAPVGGGPSESACTGQRCAQPHDQPAALAARRLGWPTPGAAGRLPGGRGPTGPVAVSIPREG